MFEEHNQGEPSFGIKLIEFVIFLVAYTVTVLTVQHFNISSINSFFTGGVFTILYFDLIRPIIYKLLGKHD